MENIEELAPLMLKGIRKAQQQELYTMSIYQDTVRPYGKNNFLFFIKPEITLPSSTVQLEAILNLILGKISAFGLHIHDVKVLSADYLKQYNLIEQHYGVIADIATHGKERLGSAAKDRFQELFGVSVDEAIVLGGTEFLKQYPFFNARSLDCLWENSQIIKLAGGSYVEKLRIGLDTVYLLNAFNPMQIEHYTEKGRSIVVMNLSGDLAWKDARSRFTGATTPQKAEKGSIRHELLEHQIELGLPEVSQRFNGIHLSAGPIEALIELQRFESDFSVPMGVKEFDTFPFGHQLVETFGSIPERILKNASVQVDGKSLNLFDLTEEWNADETIRLLKKIL
ncbi:MAG: hypothetical protein Q8914_03010 [Bacteroidota bacterium]|nr:hypothetical protein [Bacteroidota bacterium]